MSKYWKVLIITAIVFFAMSGEAYAAIENYFDLNVYELGVENNDVKILQRALMIDGVYTEENGEVTNYYGEKTAAAVKAFQTKYDLYADGVAGKNTLAKMDALNLFPVLVEAQYKLGMEGEEIKFIQRALKEEGVLEIEDYTSYYGALTKDAVAKFQEKYGLVADGILGSESIIKLSDLGYVLSEERAKEIESVTSVMGNLSLNVYKKGMSHVDVVTIQKALEAEGVFEYDEYTQNFGDVTEESVIDFQEKYGIEADGVVGAATIDKLKELGYVSTNVVVSRANGGKQYGEYIAWTDMQELITKGKSVFTIEDFYTGQTFNVIAAYGGVHSDVETLTLADSEIVKQLWGGKYSWERRPVLVHYMGRVFAASMNGMPHAGRENQPEGEYISNRSGDFGYGYNFDSIKGNGIDGHFCLHFKDSKLHSNRAVDAQHQAAVKIAAGVQ
ncbi:MAG: peptidoglycan-binding protein [Clostridia bacterium]|nr:peptidoglycan-binding protein [Clostridia bacterium]